MLRSRWLGAGIFTIFMTVPVFAAPAPEKAEGASPLAEVPAQAPIVIHIRGIDHTKDRLLAMIKNAVPDFGQMIQAKLEEGYKEALNERSLKGVAKEGPIFVVFTEMPKPGQEMPMVAIIVKVTKYSDFRDGILKPDERKTLKADPAGYEMATANDHDVYFVDHKEYAIVTPSKEIAAQFIKTQAGLDKELNKETAKKFLAADAGVYVDMGSVNKEFGGQMKAFKQFFELILQQGEGGGQIDKRTLEMIKSMYGGVFQAIEDSRSFLLTADFRPEGFALHTQANVAGDSTTNNFLKASKSAALTDLGKLRANQLIYMGAQMDGGFAKFYQPLLQGIFGGTSDKALTEALDDLAAAGPQSLVTEVNMPLEGLQVWKYKDPAKATQGQLKLIKTLKAGQNFQNLMLKDKPEVKEDAETHRDFKLNYVSMTWDFDKMAENAPGGNKEVIEGMKKMMGSGVKSWFGTDGKIYVAIAAKDWSGAQKVLDAFLDGKNLAGDNQAFQESRKQLPTKATMIAFMDGPRYAQMLSEFMGPLFKAQGLPVDFPPLKAPVGASYLGFAVGLQSERCSFDFWLPCTTVKTIRQMLPLEKLKGGDIQ